MGMEELNVTRTHKGVIAMTDEDFSAAQARHKKLTAEEKERTDKINAKNELEAWIFGARQSSGKMRWRASRQRMSAPPLVHCLRLGRIGSGMKAKMWLHQCIRARKLTCRRVCERCSF